MDSKAPEAKPKKRGRPRSGKRLVQPLRDVERVVDGLDDLLTRTYGKHIRKRVPRVYGPEEDGK